VSLDYLLPESLFRILAWRAIFMGSSMGFSFLSFFDRLLNYLFLGLERPFAQRLVLRLLLRGLFLNFDTLGVDRRWGYLFFNPFFFP
jgi:hypothetical protein